jgi:uncharacterized membrane protein
VSWQLASYLLVALALAACFAWYELSRPSSRTVALVATLAALAALGRVAFAPLTDVKPTTDIVLLAGYALGAAPGFAVGAIAAVTSNMFFGQGPWTPWQMLAWGLVGLFGALLGARAARAPRIMMALACALAGYCFGLVLDLYTWVSYAGDHSLAQFLAIEAEAFPFNLTQAIASFAFYVAFGPALLRALTRVRARLDVRFLAPALALVLAAGALAPRPAAARPLTARAALRAQLAYLRAAQNRDGGLGAAPHSASTQLYTAWAVIALASAGTDPSRVERDGRSPVAWIEAHLDELDDAGDIERTILALHAARAPLGTLLRRLRADQRPDGSFAERSNLTAFGILALRAGDAPGVSRAGAWLARQQDRGGGFSFARRGAASDVDDTAAALQALVAAGGHRAAVTRAVGYIAAARNRDGGFPQQPGGASNAQSTAWALQALVAAHARPQGIAYLVRLTTAGGAVDYSRGHSLTPVWVTAQALAALARRPLPGARRRNPRAAQRRSSASATPTPISATPLRPSSAARTRGRLSRLASLVVSSA